MNEQSQRIRIAEFCGWQAIELRDSVKSGKKDWLSGLNPKPDEIVKVIDAESGEERAPNESDYGYETLPDYTRDLNAMHDAEQCLTQMQCFTYRDILQAAVLKDVAVFAEDFTFGATASLRATAFVKTIGEWKD